VIDQSFRSIEAPDRPIQPVKWVGTSAVALGQTEPHIELAPGKHTLRLVSGDRKHYPNTSPLVSKRTIVKIK
jgi:hypothetical protein